MSPSRFQTSFISLLTITDVYNRPIKAMSAAGYAGKDGPVLFGHATIELGRSLRKGKPCGEEERHRAERARPANAHHHTLR